MLQGRVTGERARASGQDDERLLREIIEQLADGIVIVAADGRIRFANPAAEHLFARRADTLVGTDFGFPIANGTPAEIELVRPDGKAVNAEFRVVDVRWEGEPARLVSVRDITDRRRAEDRARQVDRERAARVEAEASSRAKSEFLATMSHELRTPLNAVVGYAHLLDIGVGGSLSPEQRHQVDRILASSRHLLGLVNEVLDLGKVDSGRLGVEIVPTPVDGTVEAAATLVQPAAEARGVRLIVHRSDRAGDAAARYAGDEDRVRQILVNLLSNAVKFTSAGGRVSLEYGESENPDPEVHGSAPGHWTFFRVTDTGIGIPDDQLTRIFEPFVQAESGRTRVNDGSGLGLAISRRLARLMQGDITVRSKVSAGSAFTLWLPSAAVDESEARADRNAAASEGGARGLAEIGALLMRELYAVLETFVTRLRAECPVPGAHALKFSHLADHVASYLADLAGVLVALDESGGQPSSVLVDAAEIHRVVAGRHGAQRVRLGWTEDSIRCEYRILREELDRVVRRFSPTVGIPAVEEASGVINRLLAQAERLSLGAFMRASDPREQAAAGVAR